MEAKSKYQALFVDDDPKVLNGLRRVLRPLRESWDMHFAASGPEALKLFEKQSFDLIISDMRMPEMDGEALLEKVRVISPHTVRVILSGYSEQETICKAVKHAHQFHAKPTSSDEIKLLMDRVIKMIHLLRNKEIRELVASIETLPSLPEYHTRLMEAIDSEKASLDDIAELISKDIGLSTNVLKLVNSAFFGHPKQVTEIVEAVWWLGLELLKALTLTSGLFIVFKFPPNLDVFFDDLMHHSLGSASIARNITLLESGNKNEADLAFLGGLLHDLGKLVLAYLDPDKYTAVLSKARENQVTIHNAEYESFGISHAEAGGYLTGLWGMNLAVVESLAFHHRPGESENQGFSILMAVHVANVLEYEFNPHAERTILAPEIDYVFLEKYKKLESLTTWRNTLTARK